MATSFIENINTLANATALATGDIVQDTQIARDEAVAAAALATTAKNTAVASEALAKDWSNKGHNNPVTVGEFSAYHWSVEAANAIGDPLINDAIASANYTWSSTKLTALSSIKADIAHNHNGTYEPVIVKNTGFNKNLSTAGGDNGSSLALSREDHAHSTLYEPIRVTNGTAYNKNFGTTTGTVMQGDKNFDTNYMPKVTTASAYNRAFVANTNLPLADEVPRGTHTHKAANLSYDNTGDVVVTSTTVEGAIGQLDSAVSIFTVEEKCKLNATLTDPSYTLTVATAGVFYPINAGMTVGVSKNALYSAGVVVDYLVAPTKFVEGHFIATVSLELLANEVVDVALTLNGVVVPATSVTIGSVDKTTVGAFPVTIGGFISNLENGDVLGIAAANVTGVQDIVIYDIVTSFAGQPEGAIVAAGLTVDHSDLTGTGAAAGVHTTSDIQGLDTALGLRASKVVTPVLDNLLVMDAVGDLKDSGISLTTLGGGMDLVALPTLDNVITMTSAGNSKDSGVLITNLAQKNGNSLNTFEVATATTDTQAVTKAQMDGLSTTYGTIASLSAHVALANPHGTTATDVGAAATVHTHAQADVTGLVDALAGKYTKTVTPITANIPSYSATNTLVDSGIAVATITGYQDQIDGKVDDGQVLTNVPAGALFTDTVYTHPTTDGTLHVPATSTTNGGKVLTAGSTAGSFSWVAPASGFADPLTTRGDIIYRNATVTTRLPLGTTGQVLGTADGIDLSWTTPTTGTVTSVSGTAPVTVATGTTTPAISIAAATALVDGYMTSTYASKLDGIAAGAEVNNASTTIQGNTFNGISQLVQLDGTGKLPAIDGSQLTGLSSAPVTSVAGKTGVVILTEADITDLGTYEPADATILKDADIGVTVQAYDATIVVDADIGVSVQAYDVDTAKLDVAQTFTASQAGTITTDNDVNFDLGVTNYFKSTPTAGFTLTFTNFTAGRSGIIILDNSGAWTPAKAANVKADADFLTTIAVAGVYQLGYIADGTNVYVTYSKALV